MNRCGCGTPLIVGKRHVCDLRARRPNSYTILDGNMRAAAMAEAGMDAPAVDIETGEKLMIKPSGKVVPSRKSGYGKARVAMNAFGNWNGYIGRAKVREFGTQESDARQWLAAMNAPDTAGIRLMAEQYSEATTRVEREYAALLSERERVRRAAK